MCVDLFDNDARFVFEIPEVLGVQFLRIKWNLRLKDENKFIRKATEAKHKKGLLEANMF